MLMKGNDPSAAFNLGNMLRSCGRNVEAEAALHAAIRIDPAFAEAWYISVTCSTIKGDPKLAQGGAGRA
jgi:hypothetical protein